MSENRVVHYKSTDKFGIDCKVTVNGHDIASHGELKTDILHVLHGDATPPSKKTLLVVEILESMLLALACEGYDIADPRVVRALTVVLDTISNQEY